MKATALTRNRSRRQADVSMSLFPFLAVLICTMGALIVLLVVITRQAQLQAAQVTEDEARQQQEDLQIAREDIQWRSEQLKLSRDKTAKQLDEARLALGHIEDHARRLDQRLTQLQAAYDDLERIGNQDIRQREQMQAQIEQVKAEIAQAESRLADARQAASERRGSYAVIPYQGSHETFRRPIYIECRKDGIILQPEGIVLTSDDFEGPMGPGNPLAAALRAAREHMLALGDLDPEKSGEPYPLLLVRPDGIAAFYAARAAMKSWGSEFGYELIGEDWKVDFQSPSPGMAKVVKQAIASARIQQRRLALAAPSHYRRNSGRIQYRASPTRGSVVVDGGMFGGGGSGRQPRRPSGAFGGRYEPPGTDHQGADHQGAGHQGADHQGADHQGAEPSGTSRQEAIFGPPREQQQSSDAQNGAARRPGEWRPEEDTAAGRSRAGKPSAGKRAKHVESLAKTRGQDWGLPDAAGGSVAITRPIRIECHGDRLVIVPEGGLGGGETFRLGPSVESSLDEFISGVWEHMDGWGIAGRGMYWRPMLKVQVAPGAEQRFAELETLLDGSGLAVERK